MATKIESKIVGYRVLSNEEKLEKAEKVVEEVKTEPTMCYEVERDDILEGKTFKIKPSISSSSYYITINSQKVGTKTYPREIFISSKNVEHFEYLAAITRLISAIFRRGGDVSFIVEELYAVHNPKGGYWGKDRRTGKGKYYFSILGEIGSVIEEYLSILDEENKEKPEKVDEITEKALTETYNSLTSVVLDTKVEEIEYSEPVESSEYPENATRCNKCYAKAVVRLDGCDTCLQCGDSKCG